MITLRPPMKKRLKIYLNFNKANGNAFLDAYMPIVQKRKNTSYGDREIKWQEIRRGRYVEFNLIHDRGTIIRFKNKWQNRKYFNESSPKSKMGL